MPGAMIDPTPPPPHAPPAVPAALWVRVLGPRGAPYGIDGAAGQYFLLENAAGEDEHGVAGDGTEDALWGVPGDGEGLWTVAVSARRPRSYLEAVDASCLGRLRQPQPRGAAATHAAAYDAAADGYAALAAARAADGEREAAKRAGVEQDTARLVDTLSAYEEQTEAPFVGAGRAWAAVQPQHSAHPRAPQWLGGRPPIPTAARGGGELVTLTSAPPGDDCKLSGCFAQLRSMRKHARALDAAAGLPRPLPRPEVPALAPLIATQLSAPRHAPAGGADPGLRAINLLASPASLRPATAAEAGGGAAAALGAPPAGPPASLIAAPVSTMRLPGMGMEQHYVIPGPDGGASLGR